MAQHLLAQAGKDQHRIDAEDPRSLPSIIQADHLAPNWQASSAWISLICAL